MCNLQQQLSSSYSKMSKYIPAKQKFVQVHLVQYMSL